MRGIQSIPKSLRSGMQRYCEILPSPAYLLPWVFWKYFLLSHISISNVLNIIVIIIIITTSVWIAYVKKIKYRKPKERLWMVKHLWNHPCVEMFHKTWSFEAAMSRFLYHKDTWLLYCIGCTILYSDCRRLMIHPGNYIFKSEIISSSFITESQFIFLF